MRVGVTVSDMPTYTHTHTHAHTHTHTHTHAHIQLDEKLTGTPRLPRRNAMSVSEGLTMTARCRSNLANIVYCLSNFLVKI